MEKRFVGNITIRKRIISKQNLERSFSYDYTMLLKSIMIKKCRAFAHRFLKFMKRMVLMAI